MPTYRRFKGTTALHGGVSLGNVKSANRSDSIDEINVGWDDEEIEPGQAKKTRTIRAQGHPAIAAGAVGDLVIAYKDGTSVTLANAICVSANDVGDEGGMPEAEYTFKKGTSQA